MQFCVFCWYLADKTTRNIARVCPKAVAFVGSGDDEFFLGTSHRDIPEAAFFFELIWFKKSPRMREDSLFCTSYDYMLKFESLCAVSGHEQYFFHLIVIVLLSCDEGDILEEMHERISRR